MLPFRLSFDSPGYLALLAALPLLWWASYRSLAGLGRVRRWFAILLRSVVLTLLVFALADLQWKKLSDRLTVIYVVDESLSIPEDLKPAMIDYVDREIRTHREAHINDRAGVIVFGGTPAIEHPPYDENIQVTYNTESHIDREHTNLAAALRLAQATFPEDSARRVVLLTDGNENLGDGLGQARNLADSGIGIDVVPIRYPPRAEVAVEKVVLPPDVNRGQPFDLRVVLDNIAPPDAKNAAVKGRLVITRKTQEHEEVLNPDEKDQRITLEPGKHVFSQREKIDEPDFYTYEARFIPDDAAHDTITQNKRATAYTHVRGKGQVLLIQNEDSQGDFNFLVDRLRKENLEVRVQTTAQTFATLADLQPFDTVILADTPAEGFSEEQIKMLVSNTEQMGAGLIMLGGPNSFGAGGWTNTPLEAAMPVDFQIKNSKVVPVGALAMLMHASEMAEGNFWQKKIAQEALRALGSQDYCGVMHWEGNIQWLWNPGLQRIAAKREKMLALIDKMTPGDMPEFEGAMKSALAEFGKVPDAAVKHLIVISDGDPGPPNNATMAALKAMKVTISTVAIGAHGGAGSSTLANMSSQTGGKYYVVQPGQTAKMLPRIYQREARSISRPLVFERDAGFNPHVKFPHEMIKGVGLDFPPLTGYVLTTVKDSPLVEVALVNPLPEGEKYNTLLASWTYGLGKAVAWTSDAGHRWATAWTGWENYDKLFSQIVRWSMRPGGDLGQIHAFHRSAKRQSASRHHRARQGQRFPEFLEHVGPRRGTGHEAGRCADSASGAGAVCRQFRRSRRRQLFLDGLARSGHVAVAERRECSLFGRVFGPRAERRAAEIARGREAARRQAGRIDSRTLGRRAGCAGGEIQHIPPRFAAGQQHAADLVSLGVGGGAMVFLRRAAAAHARELRLGARACEARGRSSDAAIHGRGIKPRDGPAAEPQGGSHRIAGAAPRRRPLRAPLGPNRPAAGQRTAKQTTIRTAKPPIPTAQIVPEESPESYTGRLLKAKKQVRDREKKDKGGEPPKNP